MSQASKALKEIASSQEYIALVQSVQKPDYDVVATSYLQLSRIIEDKKKSILVQIEGMPGQNMEENRRQFLTAFNQRMESTLPECYKLSKLMEIQKIAEADVFDTGSKGDPIVKTPDGKTVIVSGVKAEKGTHIKYQVTNENLKVNFARFVELNGDFFYMLLNQETLGRMQEPFNAVDAGFKQGAGNITPEVISELLTGLERSREIAAGLKPQEKDKIESKILFYRKNLLGEYGLKTAFDIINGEEEKEIASLYTGDEQQEAAALSAPGLFRQQAYTVFKNGLFTGNKMKGYEETLSGMEGSLDSMDGALKLIEFKSNIEELESQARAYITKMDELFERLNSKARYTVSSIAEEKTFDINEIQGKIESAFTGVSLYTEFNRVFRSPGEYFTLREAAVKLKAGLGDKEITPADSAVRPYLRKIINQAFQKNY